ncbi:S8 family serine peptidase [Massilia sp. IC2-477]|uniref:S8 family serine peptidase n=1 Tax=Massilia sp. IC2-477 TaxID=2887198 RepID=UPI001D0F9652|nr:S8 family serine peptidase [Massilia sp. IC2-477]MCC2958373.1 S8 family serine peptidase [Massilia sp. IC2-477]
MKLRPITSAVLLSLSLLAASAAQADGERRSYIIQLADKPVATYEGGVDGLAATKPAPGQRLNVDAASVQAYIGYLDSKKADVMSTIAGAEITNEYKVVLNGFSAMLTDDEVRALKKNSNVVAITADSILQLDTSYTPGFIGLDGPGGLWSKLGGQGAAGEDMIIGIVDSGIWPEHASFADRVDSATGTPSHTGDQLVYSAPPSSWKGACDTGEGFSAANCNNKLIGARYFKAASQQLHWTEFASARDSVAGVDGKGGHGTHTASTAAGNAGTPAVTNGLSLGKVSGMAPRARIAAYKVCWSSNTANSTAASNGCATSNSVAAIEQAVKDGVNVINFSIGPNAGGGTFTEATEQAFLGAAAAGVFVATSAGNGGPGATNVTPTAHLSPWLTSVGNATHNRLYVGDVTLGDGVILTGASGNAKNEPTQLIRARDAAMPGIDPDNANLNLCYGKADGANTPVYLDPAKVTGKILVCDRGGNVLVNKSANGKTAGAVGVIIANTATSANTIINQAHTVSTVHLAYVDGDKLKAYMASNPNATAAMGNLRGVLDPTVQAPQMSATSSRGPNVANANILKPDVSAPGSDILAAVTADLTKPQRNAVAAGEASPVSDFAFYSGTSMASPHIAGIAALLKQRHPDWTPMMIKSALMTTAMNVFGDTQNGAQAWDPTARFNGNLPWGQGAGFVRPTNADDPGLVYDAGMTDWIRFMCGASALNPSSATCTNFGSIQPYDLNLASLTAANVLGVQTLKRTVTNVGATTATYNPTVSLSGFNVTVEPSSLTLAPGQKADFSVKLTRTTAPFNTWVYGNLTWNDNAGHVVRSPLTVRAASIAAVGSVTSEATSGSKFITLGTGFGGVMTLAKGGLIPATQDTRTVLQAPVITSTVTTAACAAGGGTGVNAHDFTIASGTMLARFATFDSETSGGNSDLDLLVMRKGSNGAYAAVGSSGNGTSNENVQFVNPVAGDYRVCVIGYEPKGGADTYKLSSWIVTPTSTGGNFKAVAPSVVVVGGVTQVGLSWSGLAVGKRHMGAIGYKTGGATVATTLIEVDTTDPVPPFLNARRQPQEAL